MFSPGVYVEPQALPEMRLMHSTKVEISGKSTMSATVRNPRATIRKILDAAEREFQEHGIDGARISRIALSASTSKQIIYNYFVDKDGLCRAVLNERTHRHRQSMLSKDFNSSDPVKDLRKFVESLYDIMESHQGRFQSVVITRSEGLPDGDVFLKEQTKVIEIMSSIILKGQEACVFSREVDVVDLFVFVTATAAALNAGRASMDEIKMFHAGKAYPPGFWKEYLTNLVLGSVLDRV